MLYCIVVFVVLVEFVVVAVEVVLVGVVVVVVWLIGVGVVVVIQYIFWVNTITCVCVCYKVHRHYWCLMVLDRDFASISPTP